ncbi:hypothetical protein HYW55_01250 [Candidatus Gottesmanbacteria bacterium]|nr:hypothetical protein [Candidatus Gottesmanbacteria bacterium]
MVWDYDEAKLKRTKAGKIFLLERSINYGQRSRKKIQLREVKKYWDKLHLFPLQKRLFELFIWGKYRSSPKSKKSFWMR